MPLTFSIVVETENLGMTGLDDLRATLDSLAAQTRPIQQANEVLLVVGGHLPESTQKELAAIYPWASILDAGRILEYTLAKRMGAESASGEFVIFADSDVRYESSWLEGILSCLESDPEADLVAGDTQCEMTSAYAAAMNIMWMFNIQKRISRPAPHSYFQLNNFAVRRSLLLDAPFDPDLPFYRGYRITRFKRDLLSRTRRTYRVPGAEGLHTAPQSLADWWYLMLIQGRDAGAYVALYKKRGIVRRIVHVTRFVAGKFAIGWQNAVNLIGNDRRNMPWVIASIPLCIVCGGVVALGGLISVFEPNYLLRTINTHSNGRGRLRRYGVSTIVRSSAVPLEGTSNSRE
jgi:glycosyltransferase involved in cell wall biosynthesis